MTTLHVPLDSNSYDVTIEAGARTRTGALLTHALGESAGRRILLVADAAVSETHAEVVATSLEAAGFEVAFVTVEATEANKSLEAFEALLKAAAGQKIDRSGAVVSVGGGIICDLAGYVAASWLRGIPVFHVPTTLLAMVDASIGGKTGVNLPLPDGALGKNLVGAFWQPVGVLSDPEVLETLPERERACGLAECIKHGLVADWSLLEALREQAPDILAGRLSTCMALIARCAATKVNIVSGDEREEAGPGAGVARAFLNLGHTFAHAIEPLPELELKHGEAVAIGLMAAGACAQTLGHWGGDESEALQSTLEACGLPIALSEPLKRGRLIERMGWDKKVRQGTLTIVVPDGRGSVSMVPGPSLELLEAGWAAVGAS
ncbi:MAG: 3-dehydroquinate synthase [Planctomycetaceae bacterium]|nr:3-dehydroquinate synthase [Planctomycetaceae bacterium]